MDEELAIIQSAQEKIANSNRRKDVAILKQVLEPIEEGMGELSNSINSLMSFFEKLGKNNPEYFDKELGGKVTSSIDKVLNAIKGIKQADIKIDFSPLTALATEVKKGQDSIIDLLNRPNQSDEVIRMLSAMIGKQNIVFENLKKETDYSLKFDSLIEAVRSDNMVTELNIIYDNSGTMIKKVVPTYKNK